MPAPDQTVILWRCPRCGGTDPDTGQSARVCSRTKACAKVKRSGITEYTQMERVAYAPYDPPKDRALVAALRFYADPTNYEWRRVTKDEAPDWSDEDREMCESSTVLLDDGQRARAALDEESES